LAHFKTFLGNSTVLAHVLAILATNTAIYKCIWVGLFAKNRVLGLYLSEV
jgi:hypothetical protein